MWAYQEALAWLYARQKLGIKLGLAKVERLLERVGDPHKAFASIHVAGTNGKGSVTRMLADVLRHAGLRVGHTTSPHLVTFRERIEVDGQSIAAEQVAAGLAALRPHVEALDADGAPPTFFEVVTALAFLHFKEQGVAWAAVETGLGGRLDATNVLDPRLTIVTNVALDHTEQLGPTVGAIAWEKAGIMKPGVPCVTACHGEALLVLKLRSRELGVPMSIIGEDYTVVPDLEHLVLLRPTGESRYAVGLAGAHQRENAAVVVAAVEALRQQGVAIPEEAVRRGLRSAYNPGRLETFQLEAERLAAGAGPRSVTVLVDGAHNPAGGAALRQYLFDAGWRGFDLVAGFCADKAWAETLDNWLLPAARLWGVPVRNPRSLDAAAVRAAGAEAGVRSAAAPDVATALRLAVEAGADRIVVAGSLFLAGEAIAVLRGEPLEEIRGAQ
ncbi:MAG: dihydrofolate synthase / folylpolyglutamate synthase [Thermoplasmata archaeon]|jgi:dihydrofolate synthase/folylpolyglutamate synthase|nr:dihydrofolate synthase / folylpolyglutamate synthase [Thermoplasmata archaeon]